MKTYSAKTLPHARWWLRTRPCKRGVQMNDKQGLPPCVEFYLPLWAWPLELLHRLFFGRRNLK